MILGSAALERRDKGTVLSAALAAEVASVAHEWK